MHAIYLILLIVALVCFLLAAVGVVVHRRLNLIALGLAFWILVPLVQLART
jgi:hypothetical protein